MRWMLLLLLGAWVSGVVLGVGQFAVWVVVLVAGLVGWLAWVSKQGWWVACGVVGLVVLGFGWQAGERQVAVACEGSEVVAGVVVESVVVRADRTQGVVRMDDGCRALVVASRWVSFARGDEVELRGGRVELIEEVREYSEGYAGYLVQRGIGMVVRWPVVAVVAEGGGDFFGSWRERLRERIERVFVEPDAGMVAALLLAERGMVPEEAVTAFRAAGVGHVLAISGLHVSLMVVAVLGMLVLVPLKPAGRTVLLLVGLWLYVGLIGAPPSAMRAAVFWTITLVALRVQALVSLPTVIVLAVSWLVTTRPEMLREVGFQLSVSAVTGIFVVLFVMRPYLGRLHGFGAWLVSSGLVSLGAVLATAPLSLYHFGQASLVGVVANVVVLPVVPLVLWLSGLALLASLVAPVVAVGLAGVVHGLLAWMQVAAGWFAQVPGGFWEGWYWPRWAVVLTYVVYVVVAWLVVVRVQRRSWREVWE